MNKIRGGIFKAWAKLPEGVRRKPLDVEICLLLIMASLAAYSVPMFQPFNFLYLESPLANLIQLICVSYLILGSVLILIGLITHHKHDSLLSYCKTEMWGWRLIFSASTALFLAEFFFGTYPGVTIGCAIWLLQLITSCMRLLQYYNEKSQERKFWKI